MNDIRSAFIDEVAGLTPRILRALLEREHSDLASGILTFPQYNVLLCLYDGEPCNMHTIAGQLRLTPSNLTGIMNRLAATGMVDRFNSEDDRRQVMARITPAGKAIMDRIMHDKRQTLEHIFTCLNPQDRKNYVRIMRRILEALETMPSTQAAAETP